MSKAREPTVSTETPTPASSWKDHPLRVAAASAAVTASVLIALFGTWILPTQTASLKNQIDALSAAGAKDTNSAKQIADLKAQAADLERKLSAAQLPNLFFVGDPYPAGLGRVRVGDPISRVAAVYPDSAITKYEGYWTVEDQHAVFNHIAYYFDEKRRDNSITAIMFHVAYPTSSVKLQDKLVASLGAPKEWHGGNFSWATRDKVTVFKSVNAYFVLMREGRVPGDWPKE